MSKLDKAAVQAAIMKWPSRYETRDGRVFLGQTVSGTPAALRDAGWRNVSSIDEHDLRQMGLEIVEARYVGGVRPKKFCLVVVASLGFGGPNV